MRKAKKSSKRAKSKKKEAVGLPVGDELNSVSSKVPKNKANKKAKREPSAHGNTVRDSRGRFVKGNKAAVGNKSKRDKKSHELKAALIDAVTPQDIKDIAQILKEKAKNGEILAIRELFDRLWGRPPQDLGVQVTGSESFIEALSKATGRDDSD